MEESVTYQEILEKGEAKGWVKGKAEGKAEEARHMLILLGTERFGQADAASLAAVNAISDLQRLERLIRAVLNAASWNELLLRP